THPYLHQHDSLSLHAAFPILVYPAHGAGSLCGKNLSTDTVSTIGVQRRYNYALQPMSREAFIEIIMADQPDERLPAHRLERVIRSEEHTSELQSPDHLV